MDEEPVIERKERWRDGELVWYSESITDPETGEVTILAEWDINEE